VSFQRIQSQFFGEGLYLMAGGAESRGQSFHELELIEFIKQLLNFLGFREARIEDSIARDVRVDLSASRDGVVFLIEVKKDAPQTERRIDQQVGQLRRYEHEAQHGLYEGRPIRLVLATPGFYTNPKSPVSMKKQQNLSLRTF
jgi:hypothetical protein